MGQNSVISSHSKSIGIPWVDELSTGPLDLGHHTYLVTRVGRVDLTPSLSLEHTLLIPALSNNLLSAP